MKTLFKGEYITLEDYNKDSFLFTQNTLDPKCLEEVAPAYRAGLEYSKELLRPKHFIVKYDLNPKDVLEEIHRENRKKNSKVSEVIDVVKTISTLLSNRNIYIIVIVPNTFIDMLVNVCKIIIPRIKTVRTLKRAEAFAEKLNSKYDD
jgi:hypothetical protein